MGSIKDQLLFRDIRWLMSKVDVKRVLEYLGVRVDKQIGDEIWGWCPDHYQHVGRIPSHPKWSVNIKTGVTYCFTESRGSNLVWIVARLKHCSPKEAAEWMCDGEMSVSEISIQNMQEECKRLREAEKEKEKKAVSSIQKAREWVEASQMYEEGYHFFMHPPPPKKPTLIEKLTVDHFRCVQIRSGFYANRVVIPFFQKLEFVGFAAVDILGLEEWKKRHPTLDPTRFYNKVLYPKGFSRRLCLFGFDEVKSESVVALTEGPREVMKLWQLGYQALAVLGASMSSEQVKLLAELNPKIVLLMFDGDEQGYEAQRRIHDQLKEFFAVVKGTIPYGFDPKCLEPERVKKIFEKCQKSS